MNRPPLVSVIIPTYNRAPLLPRAIDSVLAQTYENVEIGVVDDGSRDHTQAVLGGYCDRVRPIRTENRGASHARNVGMRASIGKYIAFLDSDDSYYPYKLSLQVDFMERHPEIGMVSSNFSGVLNDGTVLENHLKQYHIKNEAMQWDFVDAYDEHEDIYFDELGRTVACDTGDMFDLVVRSSLVMSNTILFRREVLDVVGYQNEVYRIAQDYDYVVRICKHFRVALIDIPTYRLYYHDEQLSRFVTKKIYGGTRDDLSKIEYFQDVLGAVVESAYNDARYYEGHKKEIDARMADLNEEIGDLWCKCGDLRKGRKYLRKSYEIKGNRLPQLRSYIAPLFPERYKRLSRKMRKAFMSKLSSQN